MVQKFINKKSIIILFFSLFLFIKADSFSWIDFDIASQSGRKSCTNVEKKCAYGVDFLSAQVIQIPYYLKIEVVSLDENPAPLLCYSTSDQSCNTREQLAKNPTEKSVVIWAKREEFQKDDQELYIIVECQTNTCSYNINIDGHQAVNFDSPIFAYSYLVGTYNREMKFEVNGSEKNIFMTVAIDGSSKATLNLDNVYEEVVSYKNGKACTFFVGDDDEMNSSIMATFSVKGAEVGEYITLTGHTVQVNEKFEGVTKEGLIAPNGPEFTGILIENIYNEECFPIDFSNSKYNSMQKLYVTGRIHTKYAWFFLEDEKKTYLNITYMGIYDGLFGYVLTNNGKMQYICLELANDSNLKQSTTIFSISLTEPNSLNSLYNYYPPQLTGEIYRRIIPKGKIAFFSGTKNDNTAKKYDYSLYQRKGLTKMYISDCKTYPNCNLDADQLKDLTQPKPINQMSIWTTYEDSSSAIGKEKYVIIAECVDDDNDNSGYCEFETSIFSKNKEIDLVENEKFSKYVIKGEKGSFKAKLGEGRRIQRVNIDIMIFSGDVYFDLNDLLTNNKLTDEDIQVNYEKYYLSNKIFFHLNFNQKPVKEVIINFSAVLNSFFTIQYSINTFNSEQLRENVPSGESYLVQINPSSSSKYKDIFLKNRFTKNKKPFLANFFALNCEFNVTRGNTLVEFFDGYAQEVLDVTSQGYDNSIYTYNIKITEPDLSNYNHKMCMLYVAGYEAEENYERDIIVGENINQQIIFTDKFKKVRFLYPHADVQKDIAIHINVIDKAFYKIKVLANNGILKEAILAVSQTLYFKGSDLSNNCKTDTLCPIVVEAEYYNEITKTDPMIEITIREVLNTPTYLQKGQAKLDYVCGDRIYYFYTDIGKNEIGEITLNFLREYGSIWGRVVRKDQTSIDEEANWRGIYRMPSREWDDSLPFNGYTKKLLVTSEETTDCIEGCYLLISIQVSQIGEYVDDSKFYPFSILTRITPGNRAYTDIPKVVIQVDEFIIGNVDVAKNERIYEFYEVWLPHDSQYVEFDWQSSVAGLYVNLGGTRPTTKNADFKLLPPGKDSMLNITKNEILEKAKAKKIKIPISNSIQDLSLVIGIWTDKTDSINTELYSLRVHQSDEALSNSIDITEVNTDQKILCKPTQIALKEFRCLFMVTYDDDDVKLMTPLFAHSESVNHGAVTYMYADFIDRSYYDEFSKNDLNKNIPTSQTAEYNSKDEGIDYIYLQSLKIGKYMFINVISDKPDEVMMMTSMPVFNYLSYNIFDFSPNPSTEQLLNVPGEKLTLAFPESDSIMVNIVTLCGYAEISWETDPSTVFILRGWGDRISLSSGKIHDKINIRRLFSNSVDDNNKLKAIEDPGFAFYITYIAKDNNIKYDEISYGKSLQIAYKDVDLPVFLYSKIGTQYRDINVAITFRDNSIDEGGVHSSSPLKISSQLIKENTLYNAKKDDDLRPSSEKDIVGNYDTALKTAQVFLSEDIIKTFNIKAEENPILYIRIDKNEKGDFADKTFEKFNVEAQVSGINDDVIPVENIYHYGRVRNSVWRSHYKLKPDKTRPYMRVQIAFNSNNLDFIISDNENNIRSNITDLTAEKARGKVYITFETDKTVEFYYLFIYKKVRTETEAYLNNYAFKYFNVKYFSELYDYPIKNSSEISISETKDNDEDVITCTFNKLDIEDGKANVTYFFKVVENSTHYYGEEIDTIAVSESPYYTVYARNPSDNNGKITLTAKGKLSNWAYLNVIAQVQQNNILEYIAYTGIKNIRPSPKKKDEGDDSKNDNESSGNSNTAWFAIGSILLLIVIGLVVTIIIIQIKNKNLMNQVKHVSFQNTNTNYNVDPNLLMQNSNINQN